MSVSDFVIVKSAPIVQAPAEIVMSDERPDVTVMWHVSVAKWKFDPASVSESPTLAGFGVIVIFGTIVRVAVALSPMFPVTVIVAAPDALFKVLMTNEPVTDPPATEHEGVPSIMDMSLIVQLVSDELKPEPVKCIVSPPLPVLGESNIEGPVTVKVSDKTPEIDVTCGSVSVTV